MCRRAGETAWQLRELHVLPTEGSAEQPPGAPAPGDVNIPGPLRASTHMQCTLSMQVRVQTIIQVVL